VEEDPTTADVSGDEPTDWPFGAPDSKEMTEKARWFAENLKRMREDKGLSQTALARQMAEMGFPFHQMTISRIEAGRRDVGLVEAVALAERVGGTIGFMMRPPRQAQLVEEFERAINRVTGPLFEIEQLARLSFASRPTLRSWIARAKKEGVESGVIETAERWLRAEPEEYVRKAREAIEVSEEVEKYRDRLWDEKWDAATEDQRAP
jgi:transcriptional regulator with XRE-family HTH domain